MSKRANDAVGGLHRPSADHSRILGVIGNISLDEAVYPDGRTHRFVGGAALHVALAAIARGMPAGPISLLGRELTGIGEELRRRGLIVEALEARDAASCRFRIVYDASGAVEAVESSFGVSDGLTEHACAHLGRFDRYHVCCRRPLDFARVISDLAGTPYSLDFFVPTNQFLDDLTTDLVHGATVVFTNRAEFELLDELFLLASCPCVVVTDGTRPARVLREGRETASAQPALVDAVEVTGAGDTVAGAFLAGLDSGLDDAQALSTAVADAAAAVQRIGLLAD